jgi:hypothetical protein
MVHLGDSSNRIWHSQFDGLRFSVRVGAKILEDPNEHSVHEMLANMHSVYAGVGFRVEEVGTQRLDLPDLEVIDVAGCIIGTETSEQTTLFANRGGLGPTDIAVYFVRATVPTLNGCAAHANLPACIVAAGASAWTLGHEVGHVLGLAHVNDDENLMTDGSTDNIDNPPPELNANQVTIMQASALTSDCTPSPPGPVDVTMSRVRAALEPDEPDYEKATALGAAALPFLDELVRERDEMIAGKAASLAGMIGGAGAAEVLEHASEHESVAVRSAAAHAARLLEEKLAAPLLLRLMDDAEASVSQRAAIAAGVFRDPGLREKLRQMARSHPTRFVREAAKRSLEQMRAE